MKEPSPEKQRFDLFPSQEWPSGPAFAFQGLAMNRMAGLTHRPMANPHPRGPPSSRRAGVSRNR